MAAARTVAYLHELGVDWVYLSPLLPSVIGWPWDVYAAMAQTSKDSPEILCQSPYHWAGGYLLAAVVLVIIGATSPKHTRLLAESHVDAQPQATKV